MKKYAFLLLLPAFLLSFTPTQKQSTEKYSENDKKVFMLQFSWDHIPLYMHMRKSTAFTEEEIKYLAGFPVITLEKTTGMSTYGSTEKGSLEAARAIKAQNEGLRIDDTREFEYASVYLDIANEIGQINWK